MTDEKYCFEQTNKERKRAGRGAYARKNGSRSKGCSLPSDRLTEKQRKELSGKMITCNLSKPMRYAEWMNLPMSLKHEYVDKLYGTYHARTNDIAEMFEMLPNNVIRSFESWSINMDIAKKSKAYRKRTPSAEWLAFINQEPIEAPEPEEVSEPIEEPIVAPEPAPAVKLVLEMVSGTLNYKGNPDAIFEKALLNLDRSKSYHIQIRFKEVSA